MEFSDKVLFDSVEGWAAATAKGFVLGRLPLEDKLPAMEFVSKLAWNTPEGVPPPSLPQFRNVGQQSIPESSAVSAGAFSRALAIPVPDLLAKLLKIPRFDPSAKHVAKVQSLTSKTKIDISDIPTCTTPRIFDKIPKGSYPHHPNVSFDKKVDRVHVKVADKRNHLFWDATYDLKGGKFLSDTSEIIQNASPVPGFIPPCSISAKTFLNMSVDAELSKGSPETILLNPVGASPAELSIPIKSQPLPVERPIGHHDSQTTDALLCKIEKGLASTKPIVPIKEDVREKVYLPPKYQHALWRIDRGNEEASDLNPRGTPMHEMTQSSDHPLFGLTPQMKDIGPTRLGNAQFIPRRPFMNGEIIVPQLENGTFAKIFDKQSPETKITSADTSAVLQRPAGSFQPTVDRTFFSPMWQGTHDQITPLHPSIEFKHPASYARIQLVDVSNKKIVWDALFNVRGNHKIAVDQKPIGGTIQDFKGVDTNRPGKPNWFILRIDADNPKDIPRDADLPMRFWRQAQFVFGVNKPFLHADAIVKVTNNSKYATDAQIIKS